MLARAHWKGVLKLSLVSCPVALYPAIAASERISFRQVNRQTGNRLRQQLVDAVTGETVQPHNKGRGYEVGENQFLVIGDNELEAAEQEARQRPFSRVPPRSAPAHEMERPEPPTVRASLPSEDPKALRIFPARHEETRAAQFEPPIADQSASVPQAPVPPPTPIENNRTIEIDRFIPRAQIDTRYLDTPYYVVPREEVGQEAFAVIRDAMRAKDVVGMGRVVLARRERPIIVEPMADGIRGTTVRFSHEIRDAAVYFAEIPKLKLPDDMLALAKHIVEVKTSDFDTAFLEDRYRTVLVEKLREKRRELPKKVVATPAAAANVISLMDVLKRSLAAEGPAVPARPKKIAARASTSPSKGGSRRSSRSGRAR